jgi:hypothetical protein
MSQRLEDFDEVKKPAKKVQKGVYHNFTREEMAAEGVTPIDIKGKLLKSEEERSFCFYDKNLLDYEVRGQIVVMKRCNHCGTIYYSPAKPATSGNVPPSN